LLDKLAKGKSEIEIAEDLFTKIRNEFKETTEAERKVKQLRTIEQGRGYAMSMYKSSKRSPGGAAMRENPSSRNKRGLNGTIRRKLVEAKSPPTTIRE